MSLPIEYEATFENIDKDVMRGLLKEAGAELIKPEFTQRRNVFTLPKGNELPGAWLRVRDEADRVTMSLKIVDGNKIEDQKEICLTIDDFEKASTLLEHIGCARKAYHETKRELWHLDGTEITLDEWPFLEPFVEIEGPSEGVVKAAAQKLGLDYASAIFGSVDVQYAKKYGISIDLINNWLPSLTFEGPNPLVGLKG